MSLFLFLPQDGSQENVVFFFHELNQRTTVFPPSIQVNTYHQIEYRIHGTIIFIIRQNVVIYIV